MNFFTGRSVINVRKSYQDVYNILKLNTNITYSVFSKALYATKGAKEDEIADIPKNAVAEFHTAHLQPGMGAIYDKKPFKVRLVANKVYHWCLCGYSKTQPFCDGTHKMPNLKIKLRPIRLVVSEEKDYWLCNCKQTSNRPFCDGTHKRPDIQEKIKF